LTNMQVQYLSSKSLLGALGYLYQTKEEWEDELPAELEEASNEKKQEWYSQQRAVVARFMDRYFKFDPNHHVRKFGTHLKLNGVELPADAFKACCDYITVNSSRLDEMLEKLVYK